MICTPPKRIKTALALIGMLVLPACQQHNEKAQALENAQAADVALRTLVEKAKGTEQPWEELQNLEKGQATVLREHNPCYFDSSSFYRPTDVCQPVSAQRIVTDMRVQLMGQAVALADPSALKFLYSVPLHTLDEYSPLRQSSRNRFFAYADKLQGAPEDSQSLSIAGSLASYESLGIRNTSAAIGYYARAWAAGDRNAAGEAGLLFEATNDVHNAYLWSLRCTDGCFRPHQLALNELESKLSPTAIKQLQKLAATPSIVEVDTSGI